MSKPDKKTLTTQIITDNALGSFLNYMPNPDNIVPGTLSSYDTYRQMRNDPRIKSLLNKLKTAALNFPMRITQPEGCPDKVFAFVKSFDLWNSLYQKLKRIYSGLDYGFSVSELVWRYEDGLYIPDNVITRKPERFVFDKNWNLYLNDMGARRPLIQPASSCSSKIILPRPGGCLLSMTAARPIFAGGLSGKENNPLQLRPIIRSGQPLGFRLTITSAVPDCRRYMEVKYRRQKTRTWGMCGSSRWKVLGVTRWMGDVLKRQVTEAGNG